MIRTLLAIAVAFLASAGCAKPLAADPYAVRQGREQLYKFEDRDATLVGRAEMADTEKYHGPIILLDDKTPVRVPEIRSWPKNATGDVITIRGRLKRYTPKGTRGASPDEWFVLEAVRWHKGDLSPRKSRP